MPQQNGLPFPNYDLKFLIINMKTILFFATIFSMGSLAQAQKVSDYPTIYVPEKFGDFKNNQYSLPEVLIQNLIRKNYKVVRQNDGDCSIANAEILNNSNVLRNRIILKITDCKNNVLQEVKATSNIKEYEPGYRDALQKALVEIPTSNPSSQVLSQASTSPVIPAEKIEKTLTETPKKSVAKTKILTKTEPETKKPAQTSVSKSTTTVAITAASSYENQGTTYQKVNIGDGKFILVSPKSSVPFATFSKSSRPDTFRVTLEDGTSTFGYFENQNLIIEKENPDGQVTKEIFNSK